MTRDTSRAAAESVEQATPILRERVFVHISAAGVRGITCDEAEEELGLRHQTCGPRIRELCLAGRIEDSTLRRKTRSGRGAIVWIEAQPPRDGWLFPPEEKG